MPDEKDEEVVYRINGFDVPIDSLRFDIKYGKRVVEHRESGAIPQSSQARTNASGQIESQLRGKPAQGETATLAVCRALRDTLRVRGATWHVPVDAGEHDDCDCVMESLSDLPALRIQVVRADADQETWRALARDGRHQMTFGATDAARVLQQAIEKKARRYGRDQRARLTLALDATTRSALTLAPVIEAFRVEFGTWCSDQGFHAVWLVGPSSLTTYRLDEQDAGDGV